jgi:hypothetical protein
VGRKTKLTRVHNTNVRTFLIRQGFWIEKIGSAKVQVKQGNDPEKQIKIALSKQADRRHHISKELVCTNNHSSIGAIRG